MRSFYPMWSLIALMLISVCAVAEQRFEARGQPPQLIELYTSEGCSSCPPADSRLGRLLNHPGLWSEVVPMAFHVDYWDYLGWQDSFAQPEFADRQRNLHRGGRLGAVYTPGWLIDGREWRGFFRGDEFPIVAKRNGGRLNASLDRHRIKISYKPPRKESDPLVAHMVLMGFDYVTEVKAGENRGREMPHQFVVLDKQRAQGVDEWVFELPEHAGEGRRAMAVWISSDHYSEPLQALGGWVK